MIETLEKFKRDRDRQATQDKKAIEFLEGDKKRTRGEVLEARELLDLKELEIRNLAKEVETKVIELKSLEARFGKSQTTLEQSNELLIKERAKCDRATQLLTEANKAIKHKETMLRQMETKIKDLERYVKQIKSLNSNEQTSTEMEKPALSTQIEAADLESCDDGEIMQDDLPAEIVQFNKLQQSMVSEETGDFTNPEEPQAD